MVDRIGQRFGDYRIKRLLSDRGAFADVYEGEHVFEHTQAAVKIWKVHIEAKTFLKDARAAVLRHPHIVEILDFDIHPTYNVPYMVMAYAPNGSLQAQPFPLPLDSIVSYVRQIADALYYAHQRGIVHRDIKPDNILLGPQGEIWVGDFGIATPSYTRQDTMPEEPEKQLTGTPAYMAPEQWKDQVSPASDQYALGVIVYELLCGNRPFDGNTFALYQQHTSDPPPPLREKHPTISPAVEKVVMRALEKKASDRFDNIDVFAKRLEEDAINSSIKKVTEAPNSNQPQEDSGKRQHSDSSTTDEPQSPASRRYVVVILGGLGLVAAGGICFGFYLKPLDNTKTDKSTPTPQAEPTTQGDGSMSNWTLNGNKDTNPSDFLGTTDAGPLIVKTNNIEAIRIDASGNIGVGTTQPAAKLHVNADGPILLEDTKTGHRLSLKVGGSDAEVYSETNNLSVYGRGRNVLLNPYPGTGNVGVGTTAPGAKLHVEGDVFVAGNFKKTGGGEYVLQTNPLDPTQEVVYATPIGAEVGTYIRGRGKLTNGEAEIELPQHFDIFTSEGDLTVQLTPRGEWLQLYVVHSDTKRLVVREAQGKSGQFDYFVQGMRKGYENHQVFQEKALTG